MPAGVPRMTRIDRPPYRAVVGERIATLPVETVDGAVRQARVRYLALACGHEVRAHQVHQRAPKQARCEACQREGSR